MRHHTEHVLLTPVSFHQSTVVIIYTFRPELPLSHAEECGHSGNLYSMKAQNKTITIDVKHAGIYVQAM